MFPPGQSEKTPNKNIRFHAKQGMSPTPPQYTNLPVLGDSIYLPKRLPATIKNNNSIPKPSMPTQLTLNMNMNLDKTREVKANSVVKNKTPTQNKKRRNRLSFVCQACRLAKSKCDKEKPECSRCDKLGIECIYDTAIQPAPKHLSKDATILRLENEVDYWQKKTKMLLDEQSQLLEQEHNMRDDTPMRQESLLELTTKKGEPLVDNIVIDTANGPINFNDDFFKQKVQLADVNPRLIMSKVMKREVNPLSPNYIMINDAFFAITLMSIFINPASLKSNSSSNNNTTHNSTHSSGVNSTNISRVNSNSILVVKHDLSSNYTESNHGVYADHLVSAITVDISISRTHQVLKSNLLKLQKILLDRCPSKDKRQIAKINNFCNRIIGLTGTSDVGKLLENWMNPATNEHLEDTVNFDFDENDSSKLEDHYSPLLKEMIASFESYLPPLPVVNSYKQHFYENVYSLLPFADLRTFHDCITEVVIADPANPEKCKLNLGNSGIRNKIENICILACVLKISYMFMSMLEEGELIKQDQFDKYMSLETLHKYPIKNDIIVDVLRCLISENWAKCPNENIVSILLYMWAFFVFSPDEGDFFATNPTEFVCDLVVMLSSAIGLHRDPNDYAEIRNHKNKRLKNHRRLLWLSVISMSSYENALKGRRVSIKRLLDSFIDISSPMAFENYMNRIKEDLVPECQLTTFTISLHEMAWRRTHLALLHQNLNGLTMSYNKPVALWDIEKAMSYIDVYIKEHLHFKSDNVNVVQLEGSPEDVLHQMSILTTRPSLCFISEIMSKNLQVRTTYALMLHFENPGFDSRDKEIGETFDERIIISSRKQLFLPYYLRYLKMSINNCLDLIQLYEDFYRDAEDDLIDRNKTGNKGGKGDSKDDLRLSSLTKYYVSKFLQLSLSTAMFTLLVIIVRIAINKLFLAEDNEWGKNDKKIDALGVIQDILRTKLKKIHTIVTRYLKYSYFSVFKILSMYDLLIHRLINDKLMNGLFKPITERDVDPRMAKFFKMSFNIQFSDGNAKLIDLLRDKNHISMIDTKSLIQFMTELKSNHREKTDVNFEIESPSDSTISYVSTDVTSNTAMSGGMGRHLDHDFIPQVFPRQPPMFNMKTNASSNAQANGDNKINNDNNNNNNNNDNINNNNNVSDGMTNPNLNLNNPVVNPELSLNDDDISNLWDAFTPDEEQLSKTFAGFFGDLDMFDYNYFFNNNDNGDGSQNGVDPTL
ncbi:oleate-activated transcription factor 1 [Monosporozyma unispora]